MEQVYRLTAIAAFWAGVFFAFLEVVYGYFFGVWGDVASEMIMHPQMSRVTKAGETALFGFLAFAFFAMSISASRLRAAR